ncbi:hypothetical protein FLONG3_1287 [Fusarium longipes]|uniref:Uncharacterized protein n=1 Tax=Fusarium longipes TaxID=694270 RepID=A0A395T755_9HYPO|nr:hypothetical protein FLONG3_1287 [Fusarium longipes]
MTANKKMRKEGIPCPRCQEDDTISQELKDKLYYDATHLHDHEVSRLHLPKQKWVRQITQAFEASGEERIGCPYCKKLGKDVTFHQMRDLVKHVEDGVVGATHDELKRADGWYDEGWDKHPESKSKTFQETPEQQHQRRLAAHGIRYSQYEPTPGPIPHPTVPGVVLAPGHPDIIPEHLRPFIKFGRLEDEPRSTELPEHLRPFIKFGRLEDEPLFQIPEYWKGVISSRPMRIFNSDTLTAINNMDEALSRKRKAPANWEKEGEDEGDEDN